MAEIAHRILGVLPDRIASEQAENRAWPIYIYTFGRFSLVINGEVLRFSRKSQKKPLSLLKALIAFGGREVSEEILIDALWPEHEGDKGAQNFKVTLYRLRKLLEPQVLHLQERRLSLDTRYCWVDVWSFERLLNQVEAAGHYKQLKRTTELLDKAISLYHGPFLAHECGTNWSYTCRERLRARFLFIIGRVGDELYRLRSFQQALFYYQKGIEINETAEHFYRGLMRCHYNLENKAEGMTIYQMCKNKLKKNLNISPSTRTEHVYRLLKHL